MEEISDTDEIISEWRFDNVNTSTYSDEKLKEFIDEFYTIADDCEYGVTDLNDTMDGEYGKEENTPTLKWDETLFVILLPNNKIQIESGEGNEQFDDWMNAKDYLIEQGVNEGVPGFVSQEQDDEDQEQEEIK